MSCDLLVFDSDRTEIGGENRYIILACASFFNLPRKTLQAWKHVAEETVNNFEKNSNSRA